MDDVNNPKRKPWGTDKDGQKEQIDQKVMPPALRGPVPESYRAIFEPEKAE
ncbi:hypothetical protein [Aneurinibacillus tyrosinisolvens]|uniref:hypothetical protein n=1 Tax=Aneurinibacillus tyrosinisolvens TaxID=1443435 RepID=UPI000B33D71B|nr:hypothetical protein [Aneurinibacillus tyrosinisolvens]